MEISATMEPNNQNEQLTDAISVLKVLLVQQNQKINNIDVRIDNIQNTEKSASVSKTQISKALGFLPCPDALSAPCSGYARAKPLYNTPLPEFYGDPAYNATMLIYISCLLRSLALYLIVRVVRLGVHQSIVHTNGMFDGNEISKMKDYFHLTVSEGLKSRVKELEDGEGWTEFTQSLQEEFVASDSQRVARQSFKLWIYWRKKGLSVAEVLREFERQSGQLTFLGRTSLEAEKSYMEDDAGNLPEKFDEVRVAITRHMKKYCRKTARNQHSDQKDRPILLPTISSKPNANAASTPNRDDQVSQLVKEFEKFNLYLLKGRTNALNPAPYTPPEARNRVPVPFEKRCIFCNDTAHSMKRDRTLLSDYFARGLVKTIDGKLASSNGEPIPFNWGKGGMRRLVDNRMSASTSHISLQAEEEEELTLYGVSVTPSALGKFTLAKDHLPKMLSAEKKQAATDVWSTTGWDDPVNALSIQVFSAAQEAYVEEKRLREAEDTQSKKKARTDKAGPSNRPKSQIKKKTHFGDDPMDVALAQPAATPQKQQQPSTKPKPASSKKETAFKLKSLIELKSNPEEIFQKWILEAKVVMSLEELLCIAKPNVADQPHQWAPNEMTMLSMMVMVPWKNRERKRDVSQFHTGSEEPLMSQIPSVH
ncbi:hypothetical protein DFS34DRAFT_590419 [Phlyctochytrium arcticum]|nr:hypothetical protein DFS34DRAFT_590419 [Phlyctochytrium arcticum]